MVRKGLSILAGLFLAQSSFASLLTPLSIEEMSAKSALIVHAKVLSKSCQRDPAGRIYTKVDLELTDVWKGVHPEKQLSIVHGGGVLGEERVVVSNQVQYDIGEEVVAFCVLNQRGEAVTLGLCQGKFHVWKDDDGQLRVRNPFHGQGTRGGAVRLNHRDDAIEDALTLAQLKDRVKGKAAAK